MERVTVTRRENLNLTVGLFSSWFSWILINPFTFLIFVSRGILIRCLLVEREQENLWIGDKHKKQRRLIRSLGEKRLLLNIGHLLCKRSETISKDQTKQWLENEVLGKYFSKLRLLTFQTCPILVRFGNLPFSSSFPSWLFSAQLSWRLFCQHWPVFFSLGLLLQLLHAQLLFQQP